MINSLRVLIFLCFVSLITSKSFSQATGPNYNTAIGFRFAPGGVTVKHFVKSNAALEGIGYFWKDAFRATGLYEWHQQLGNVQGLKWFAGIGAHIDFLNNEYKQEKNSGGAAAGMDGIIGLDYKFTGAPINLSLDWQPSVTFIGESYSNSSWAGLSFRFAF